MVRSHYCLKNSCCGILATAALFFCAAPDFAVDLYTALPPGLVGYDSRREIHIHSATEADAVRRKVIQYFWGGAGLPTAIPAGETVYSGRGLLPADLIGLNRRQIAKADKLTARMDYRYSTKMYLLHPVNTRNANRLVIVSHGHSDYGNGAQFNAGVGTTIDALLTNGFTVLAMQMPMRGWNASTTFVNAPGHPGSWSPTDHTDLVNGLEGADGKSALRFFIEPVVQGINKFIQLNPGYTDISMTGLSGGGWTTVLAAAVDTRIKISVAVAGSEPIYARPYYPGSVGDGEQTLPAMYNHRASYLDLYILDSCGTGRKSIQTNNQFDDGCFYGIPDVTWTSNVQNAVNSTGAGSYNFVRDTLAHHHEISNSALYNVIIPALGVTPIIPATPAINEKFGAAGTPPSNWSYYTYNSASATVTAGGGVATFSGGSGTNAIVYNNDFDPRPPTTAKIKINSIASGGTMGLLVTDNPNLRDRSLGIHLDASGHLYLDSDNGGASGSGYGSILLTTLSGYSGGAVTLTLAWDAKGCTVAADVGNFSRRLDFPLPNHFSLGDLGGDVYLLLQRSGNATASVDSVTVTVIPIRTH